MKLNVVQIPSIKEPIQPSRGFAKKGLSDFKLDACGKCGKVIAVFTDGEPSDVAACTEEMRECRRRGIRVLVGAVLGGDPVCVSESMPGAATFEVGGGFAGFHQAIRRIAR